MAVKLPEEERQVMAENEDKVRKVSERSRVRLSDGRVVIVQGGDAIPKGAKVVGKARSTVSEEPVRSADVQEPSSGEKPSRKRKSKE